MTMSLFGTCKISTVSTCGCRHYQNVKRIHQSAIRFVVPKNLKGKSTSSQQWITRQLNDPFVVKARKEGYRARSAYKLLELNEKFKILKPGQIVVDCGASPGAWTQVIVQAINSDGAHEDIPNGKVIAIDLLPIEPILGAKTVPNCDFTDPESQKKILRLIRNQPLEIEEEEEEEEDFYNEEKIIDVILSDMAPNATGIGEADHYRIIKLVRMAADFALQYGKKGGSFVAKLWDGSDSSQLKEDLKNHYKTVKHFKPNSSRDSSSELFICAQKKIY